MNLDLREMPILTLNVPDDARRRTFMQAQLDKFGLEGEFAPGVRCAPNPVGCALSHMRALRLRAPEPPFLVLEDDCEFFEGRFHYSFEVPDDTDALYLGHSSFGLCDEPDQWGNRWGRLHNVRSESLDADFIRVFNMVGRHAIIYVSPEFVSATIDAGERALLGCDFPIPGDVRYAELQPDYQVLAVREPICVQAQSQGGRFEATRVSVAQDAVA